MFIDLNTFTSLAKHGANRDEIFEKLLQYRPEVFIELYHMDEIVEEMTKQLNQLREKGNRVGLVSAIKIYRSITGTELKDAKRQVELYIDQGLIVIDP